MKGHSIINYTKSEVDEHDRSFTINYYHLNVAQKIKGVY